MARPSNAQRELQSAQRKAAQESHLLDVILDAQSRHSVDHLEGRERLVAEVALSSIICAEPTQNLDALWQTMDDISRNVVLYFWTSQPNEPRSSENVAKEPRLLPTDGRN